MASQFRDVLRDFALEKMKEIEKQDSASGKESSSSRSGRKRKEDKEISQTSEKDRDKTDLRALISSRLAAMAAEMRENESNEKKGSHKKRQKHTKRDEHSHKRKKKDKKHSSSKHKTKHKKKSSHHRSGHHSKKDKTKKGSDSVVEGKSPEFKDGVDIETRLDKTGPSGSDTQNTDTEDNSMDSDSERSVSPPFQVGKEIEVMDIKEDFPTSLFTAQLPDENVVATKDRDAQNEMEDRTVSSGNNSEKISETEKNFTIKNTVDKGVEKVKLKPDLTSPKVQIGSVEEKPVTSQSNELGNSKQIVGMKNDISQESSQADSKEKIGDKAAKICQLESKLHLNQNSGINRPSASEVINSVNSDMIRMGSEEKNNISNNVTKENNSPLSAKDGDALTSSVAEASGLQTSSVKTESVPQKSQAKAKLIKINIKTQELPENPQKAAEEGSSDVTKDVDESEESEDAGDDKGSNSGKPWRIVPEEGELTPSSSEDEGVKEEAGMTEENEESKEKRHKHRKHRKRKKSRRDGREEGEIVEKKKRHKDGPENEISSSKDKESTSMNSGDKEDVQKSKSKSPQRKTVKSSVSSVVTSQTTGSNYPDRSRSRSRSPRQYKSGSRSPRSYSSRNYYHRSRSRSPRSFRSRSPRSYRSERYDRRRRRSRSGERGHYRSRSDSRERSRSRDRRRYRSRSHSREGSWSRDRGRRRSRSLSKGRYRSKSRSVERKRRERSFTPVEEIDKKKLLEIAKANAYMYQRVLSGDLPASTKVVQTDLASNNTQNEGTINRTVPTAARTVDELTEVCKGLSKQEVDESSDDEPVNVPVTSDDEEKDNFIRHPFQVKERPASIVVNIQNATPMPVLNSKETLRVQFPVSSGTQHRKKEDLSTPSPYGEWQPVKKPETIPQAGAAPVPAKTTPAPTPAPAKQAQPTVQPPSKAGPSVAPPKAAATAAAPAPLPGAMVPSVPPPVPVEDRVFDETPSENVNIADVVAMRLKAARALQTNPLDVEALSSMHSAQRKLQNWINRDNKPGLFTGSTDANILTPQQLANPNRKHQAWAKKVALNNGQINMSVSYSSCIVCSVR
ncbi:Protein SON [Holothuria leucospilota]|uniref:Protein SON n=1 Tax=Holothuria leucospilota TaxID=206669 RepID=A0A9Q0YQZ6_HOLLE|nr:Protein SON [Holothuria leucospilota]